jgi:hypothetical protein
MKVLLIHCDWGFFNKSIFEIEKLKINESFINPL